MGYQVNWRRTLSLAFQSVGVVYGDIGTSPLYVFASTFSNGTIGDTDDVIGVLSLIIYTIALVPLLKYVFIVLWANDNGDGGTFALYSLLCRYVKVGLIPNEQPEDMELSNYQLLMPSNLRRSQKVKEKLENSMFAKVALFLVTIAGTSMVIGDGVLTPSISGICFLLLITSSFYCCFLFHHNSITKSTNKECIKCKIIENRHIDLHGISKVREFI